MRPIDLIAFAALAAMPAAALAQGAPHLAIVARIAGPDGGWDYASADPGRHRVYVAHGDKVMAIDTVTNTANFNFAAGAHLHAVVPIPGSDRLVTTNGAGQSARVLSAADGAQIASVATPPDPDGAVFDSFTGDVAVVSGDPGLVSLVDPKSARIVGTVKVGDGLEFPAIDGKGRLYVNIEESGEIAVIDLAARKLVARYPMAGCKGATGLALTRDGRLISACGNGVVKILAAADGKEIASLTIGQGPDAVLLDDDRGYAYVPSRTGTLAVIALAGPAANTIVETATTQVGARTGAVDPATGRIYLPTARFGPAAGAKRPPALPGSFEVLVLDRSR